MRKNTNNSLSNKRPDLINEWDYTKNNGLTPDEVTCGSEKKVWWICPCKHSYEATISNRARLNSGCPYCAGQKAIIGENDLTTLFPDIAREWNYDKNEGLMPCEFLPKSNKKVWWICSRGHNYRAKIGQRTGKKGTGCPYCAGQKVIKGENDLATVRPDIAKQWDYKKNINLSPNNVLPATKLKVWWICDNGHSYEMTLNNRTSLNRGCPYCAGKKVITGENDLATLRPDIAKDWDLIKNKGLLPSEVPAHCSKKVWWICNKGHSYDAYIYRRTNKNGTGCPYCAGNKPLKGETDLETWYPDLAKEWDYDKNVYLKPSDVTSGSEKKVWWKCDKGHSFMAKIHHRTHKEGSKCPYCSGKLAIKGETDLETVRPDIAKQWDYERNKELIPCDYTVYSNKNVYWKCEMNHSYKARICNRTSLNRGCPYCAGQKPIKGETDFATVYPDLVALWNKTRNGNLKPTDITASSGKKVWWKCPEGHEWRRTPHLMGRSLGCPVCSKIG